MPILITEAEIAEIRLEVRRLLDEWNDEYEKERGRTRTREIEPYDLREGENQNGKRTCGMGPSGFFK